MIENLDECHRVAVKAAKHVGEIIRSRIWQSKSKVDMKSSDIDLVTDTDKEVEDYLKSTFARNFPDHFFYGEESVADGSNCKLTLAPTWIVDPVDGTLNFVHGYPNVCVSIALCFKKLPRIAIIYNPIIDFFFEAREGKGAKLNGEFIHVSKQTELSKALVAFETGTQRDPEKTENVLLNFKNLIGKVQGLRSAGSAAMNMALVALGACDAYFEFGVHAWDVAAGDLIVREAGGIIQDPAGTDFDILSRKVLCASTFTLGQALSKELIQFNLPRD